MQKDNLVFDLINKELERQRRGIELIASENFASLQVIQSMGNVMTNKYAEGYPGRRYYGGCEIVDQTEQLAIERVKEIAEATGIPLVLHGGSGNSEDDFKQSIANGINIVHINTEIRVAYRDGLKKSLQENPDEVAPYKILKPAMKAVADVVLQKLKFFNNL